MIRVGIFFDKRNAKEGHRYVTWLINVDGKQTIVSTGLSVTEGEADFLKKNKSALTGRTKDEHHRDLWQLVYGEYLPAAQRLIDNLGDKFTFIEFKNQIFQKKPLPEVASQKSEYVVSELVIDSLISQFNELHAEERFGSAYGFRDSASSLKRFIKHSEHKGPLLFSDVDVKFLKSYERWMLREGKVSRLKDGEPSPASMNTIGIYTRNIRTVFNLAIKEKIIDKDSYPFGNKKYIIPKGNNVKKAVTIEVIQRIMNYQFKTEMEERSRDLWLFSYFSNGANMADILRLRQKDLGENEFSFVRRKTINTKKHNIEPTQAFISDISQAIIKRWENPIRGENEFVFNFLNRKMSALQQHQATKLFITTTNRNMKKIAKSLEISGSLTTYAARHSFSTIMLHSGANLAMISKMLSHSTLTTTQNYFGDFKTDTIREAVSALIPKKPVNPEPAGAEPTKEATS